MCGICGIKTRSSEQPPEALLRDMAGRLAHRGPDDEGFLTQPGIGLGFRRLSIIDVAGGHQPVHSEDKQVWVILNGEIYNYIELRATLEKQGHTFYTNGDTETIAHAYEQYGLDFVHKLRGMFAAAIWDASKQRLVLARDRIGKKPLYYAERDGQLAFASEVKALYPWPRLNPEVDYAALSHYLSLLYIPAPLSILKDVFRLPPGHMLIVTPDKITLHDYGRFKLPERPLDISLEEAQERLDELLLEATRIRLRSDVPLGAFLSGGVDSSAVVYYMQRANVGHQTQTYSMGFEDASFDERQYARAVANRLDTDHHEELVTPVSEQMLLDLIWYMDEPFGDSSSIPTYLVSQAARRHVTVALSGDGGDELFAGYNRYIALELVDQVARKTPGWLRRFGRGTAQLAYQAIPDDLTRYAKPLRLALLGLDMTLLDPPARVAPIERYFSQDEKLSYLTGDALAALGNMPSSESWMTEQYGAAAETRNQNDPLAAYLYVDTLYSLPDDMLTKVDRMAMANGLEVRCPLLDQEVVDFVLSLPREFKIHKRDRKIILKRLMADRLPNEIMYRPKMGFSVPFGPWLTSTFRPLVEDCLSADSLRNRGIFAVEPTIALRDSVLRHPTGEHNRMSETQRWHRVWLILVFELWARRFLDGKS